MINTSKPGTQVYMHILDVLIMYYLKKTGHWSRIYINYLPAIEYIYLNLDVEANIYQSLKYINTWILMTLSVKYVITRCTRGVRAVFFQCKNAIQ